MRKYQKFIVVIAVFICSCKSPVSPPFVNVRIITFVADPKEIALGAFVTLTWQTENAIYCEISGVGQVAVNGTLSLQLQDPTTFELTAKGKNDDIQKASVFVIVNKDDSCKYLTITYYRNYGTNFHVETSENQSKFYALRNVEITVLCFDENNNLIDSGVGIIPFIPIGSKGIVDVILKNGVGYSIHHSSVAITKCSSY